MDSYTNKRYKYVPQSGAKPTTPRGGDKPTKAQPHSKTYTTPRDNSSDTTKSSGGDYKRKEPTPFPTLDPSIYRASPLLLTDQQVAKFIVDGYLELDTGLPAEFHDALYTYANGKEISRFVNNPGNNVLPVIPSLDYVFECPTVRGALLSLLGKDYMMHPHRHPHCNNPGFKGQQFHKDSFFGYELTRHHFPVWVMAMYYPQDTPIVLGPTAISATTQYMGLQETRKRHLDVTEVWGTNDVPLECKKGTVVLIHYDLWHKGTPNNGTINRFMFKFQFTRMTPPIGPTWQNASPEFPFTTPHALNPLHVQMWKWMRGDTTPTEVGTSKDERKRLFGLARDHSVHGEPGRLNAAYTLAHDPESVDGLFDIIYSEDQCVRRSVLYGLSSSKDEQVAKKLKDVLSNTRHKFPYHTEVMHALGDMGKIALSALPVLYDMLGAQRGDVKSAAVEAIGLILYWFCDTPDDKACEFLKQAKWQDDFCKVVKKAMSDSEEEVRFSACLTIARLGKLEVTAHYVDDLERCATVDQNRYVRAYALEALQRVNTMESNKIALRILRSSHYCAVTTFDSTF